MAIRGIGDAFAFQRLLWLLVGTVVVPTALLALYGVVAIRNERHAMGERVRTERMERVQWAHALITPSFAEAESRVVETAPLCGDSTAPCSPTLDGVERWYAWPAAEAGPSGLESLELAEGWQRHADGEQIHLVRSGEVFVAWVPDLRALADELESETASRWPESAPVVLELSADLNPLDTFDRWHSYRPVLPLEAPLTDYHLSIGPDDPQDAAFSKRSSLLGMGLVALVLTVLAGTVVTLRSAMREIRLSRLQTDFVSNVSHELKTPLTSISMFVETLRSGRLEDPERVEECLDLLASETDRLSRRIERVLSWARMEAGKRVYEVEPVDAEEIIAQALSAIRSQRLEHRDATEQIDVSIPDDLSPMLVDRDAIVEALLNLISNALKYTPEPRSIQITAEESKGRVGLSVADNGPGIAPRDRRRIFEKFYQADTLLSRSVEGSGLGLSIVRAVIHAHKGRVELDSELGEGSRFTLWLPVAP
ncbi:MAG: hypothetical protein KC912_12600 [Proteobacteria bacterium]|nr:hypothetical protein [Pseudomonadota bacterium]